MADLEAIRLERSELAEHAFVAAADLDQCLNSRLVRRITASLVAVADWRTCQLERSRARRTAELTFQSQGAASPRRRRRVRRSR